MGEHEAGGGNVQCGAQDGCGVDGEDVSATAGEQARLPDAAVAVERRDPELLVDERSEPRAEITRHVGGVDEERSSARAGGEVAAAELEGEKNDRTRRAATDAGALRSIHTPTCRATAPHGRHAKVCSPRSTRLPSSKVGRVVSSYATRPPNVFPGET